MVGLGMCALRGSSSDAAGRLEEHSGRGRQQGSSRLFGKIATLSFPPEQEAEAPPAAQGLQALPEGNSGAEPMGGDRGPHGDTCPESCFATAPFTTPSARGCSRREAPRVPQPFSAQAPSASVRGVPKGRPGRPASRRNAAASGTCVRAPRGSALAGASGGSLRESPGAGPMSGV